ncbi:hypothetical protein MJO28_007822 [Puccinia striiformis f. sp. tritici]|uniref:Uncharacterized protein n=1 Tax=Puccinia striiformis f. sp. tritici TaxID=168172 RepID=A0ACC0EGR7_9BASI|nr:hypothetical protein MJO28_007822 [Puccinia striiformis f. sp. tritici]
MWKLKDETEEFRPFPEQETPATDEPDVLEEEADVLEDETGERVEVPQFQRPAQEIRGDITSENILSHRRRGVPESNLNEIDDDTLSYREILAHPDKSKWIDALSGEANNLKDYEVWDLIDKSKEETPLDCTWKQLDDYFNFKQLIISSSTS